MEVKPLLLLAMIAFLGVLSRAAADSVEEEKLAKDADFIDELPNQPSGVDFRQYSGYILVDPKNYRQYFYYFVEAEGDHPLSKPLIVYVNNQEDRAGSPLLPCFEQVGPFRIDEDGQTLYPNPYSWNKFANLLFVEGPIGVGFSISNNTQDIYETSDYYLMQEFYEFLSHWLQRFPEHKTTEMYIAGQNYIGAIGPAIGSYILYKNSINATQPINLKGLLMGNPRIDKGIEYTTRMESLFRMNIVPEELLQEYQRLCLFKQRNNTFLSCWSPLGQSQTLRTALDDSNVYLKFCPNLDLETVGLENIAYYAYDCYENIVAGYLNIPFVQRMMHAQDRNNRPPMWQPTAPSHTIWPNITYSESWMKAMMTKGVRLLIYSAMLDIEIVIPNMSVIKSMNLTIASEWKPWFTNTVELAGFYETYVGGLTYATIRNAGGKAMADQPHSGFILTKSFVTNTPLPTTKFV